MSNPEFTAPNFNTQTATAYKANLDAAIAASGDYSNIGFSYSGGTFTVHGHEGTALSSTNPAFIRFQNQTTSGQNLYISIEANQDFIDDAGASEIVGNTFGTIASTATDNDVVFYLYAVANDAQDTVAMMISRMPDQYQSPAFADIGAPDDAVADNSYSFFSLENIDETLYDNNPCVMIGSFVMSKSSSDDWTVTALTHQDGVGRIRRSAPWPHNPDIGGSTTDPTTGWTTDDGYYEIQGGKVFLHAILEADGSTYTGGSGSLELKNLPFFFGNDNKSNTNILSVVWQQLDHNSGATAVNPYTLKNDDRLRFAESLDLNNISDMSVTDFKTNSRVYITGHVFVQETT